MKKLKVLLSALLFIFTGQSFAGLVLNNDDRILSLPVPGDCFEYDTDGFTCISSGPRETLTRTPDTSFQDWNETLFAFEGGATQTSNITTNGMSGSGSIYAGDDAVYHYGALASNLFDATFGVTENTDFSLSGMFTNNYFSNVYVELLEDGISIFRQDANDGISNFNYSNVFNSTSEYQLILLAEAVDTTDYNNEAWNFALTTVPLPGAVYLFGAGLITLFHFGRKKIKAV